MANDRWYSHKTQIYWVCKALVEGREISHRCEIREVDGWRLAAVVHNLVRNYKWPIDREYRGPEHIAFYKLRPGTDPTKLRYPPSAAMLLDDGDNE